MLPLENLEFKQLALKLKNTLCKKLELQSSIESKTRCYKNNLMGLSSFLGVQSILGVKKLFSF